LISKEQFCACCLPCLCGTGFVVTHFTMERDWIIHFIEQLCPAEQHIKQDKQAINWTRLSCKGMPQNEVRFMW